MPRTRCIIMWIIQGGVTIVEDLYGRARNHHRFTIQFHISRNGEVVRNLTMCTIIDLQTTSLFRVMTSAEMFRPRIYEQLMMRIFATTPLFRSTTRGHVRPKTSFARFRYRTVALPTSTQYTNAPHSHPSPSVFHHGTSRAKSYGDTPRRANRQ